MAQDYGAANGLVNLAKRYVGFMDGVKRTGERLGLPTFSRKVNPEVQRQTKANDDAAVRRANEGFRKAAESNRKTKGRTTSRKRSGRSSKR